MRRRARDLITAAASLACLTLLAHGLCAADYEQRQLDGTAVLRFGTDRTEGDTVEMALGLERTLTVTIEGPAPLGIQNEAGLLEAETAAVGTIWDYKRDVRKVSLPGNRERWQLIFQIDPRAEKGKRYPVEHTLQLVPITFHAGSTPIAQTV